MSFTQIWNFSLKLCSESSDRTTDNFCNYIKITKLCEPRVCCHWDGKQKKLVSSSGSCSDSHSRSRNLLRSTIFANFFNTEKKSRVGIPLVYNFHCLRWNSSKAINFCRSMEPFRGLALTRKTSSHRFHVFLSFYLISDKYKRSFSNSSRNLPWMAEAFLRWVNEPAKDLQFVYASTCYLQFPIACEQLPDSQREILTSFEKEKLNLACSFW